MNNLPKEKAKDLFVKFSEQITYFDELEGRMVYSDLSKAKRFALIAVDEILNINSVDKDFSLSHYWQEVKEQINNL